MKKFLLGTTLLTLAAMSTPAQAAGVWTVGPQTVTFDNVGNPLGDGSDAQGGLPPAYAYELPDYATNGTINATTVTSWTSTMGSTGTIPNDAGDNKFRTHCNFGFEAKLDPLVFPGEPNKGHEHSFFGNTAVTENSTYQSLRTTGGSTCAGGPLNRSAYWMPSMKEQRPSGVIVTRKFQRVTVYYTSGSVVDAQANQRIPRGFGYVGGKDPMNFNNAAKRAEVPAGWTYQEDEGFEGWECQHSADQGGALSSKYPRLKEADGTVSFQCHAGDYIIANLVAPPCWDGKNLTSPDARSHVRYRAKNNNDGKKYCPKGWYSLPGFRGIVTYGPLEYDNQQGNWWLSSDRMNPVGTAPDPTSLSPCRQVSKDFCNGETDHFDWFGAWDYGTKDNLGTMLTWMKDCSGVTLRWADGTSTAGRPAACSDSTITDYKKLLTNGDASPDATLSLNPVISFSDPALVDRFVPIKTGTENDFTIEHNHSSLGNDLVAPEQRLAFAEPLSFDLASLR